MFDHVSIGVKDIGRAGHFYDAAFKPLGYTRLSDSEGSLGYGDKAVGLWISASEKPVKADPASGLHFCFVAKSRAAVDAFHAAALAAGGKDNGKPGLRKELWSELLRGLRHRSGRLPHRGPLREVRAAQRSFAE